MTELQAIADARIDAVQRVSIAEALLNSEREQDSLAVHLSALLEHGEAVGLIEGHCPLCEAIQNKEVFASALVALRIFAKLLLGMRAWFMRFPQKTAWFQPVAGGLLVGVMGWFVPQVLGVGYGFVGDALNGNMAIRLMLLLLVLKLIAVTTSYASGNAGGIFGPALFIGAMLGGSVGTAAHHLFPAYTATAGAYALVGMGAVFAGVVNAPRGSADVSFFCDCNEVSQMPEFQGITHICRHAPQGELCYLASLSAHQGS